MHTHLIEKIEHYCQKRGIKETTFSRLAYGSGALFKDLKKGKTVTLKTEKKIKQYISENPPNPKKK